MKRTCKILHVRALVEGQEPGEQYEAKVEVWTLDESDLYCTRADLRALEEDEALRQIRAALRERFRPDAVFERITLRWEDYAL